MASRKKFKDLVLYDVYKFTTSSGGEQLHLGNGFFSEHSMGYMPAGYYDYDGLMASDPETEVIVLRNIAPVEDKGDYIGPFDGEYRFLSNFHPCRLVYDGLQYPTAEHAYQAAKSHDYSARLEIKNLPTPGDAKRAGKKIVLREHWDAIRVSIMTEIQLAKYTQNAALAAMLIRTGAQKLQERNNWGDKFWGMDMSGRGDNQLGEVLMRVRDILNGSYKMRVLTDTAHSELSYLTKNDTSLR